MNKHTPGPYSIDWNISRLDIHADGKLVATVRRHTASDADDAVAIANAQLLAAAPTLLRSLASLLAAMACYDSTPEETLALADAKDAIAKATGEKL